jgi:hypothetical protein
VSQYLAWETLKGSQPRAPEITRTFEGEKAGLILAGSCVGLLPRHVASPAILQLLLSVHLSAPSLALEFITSVPMRVFTLDVETPEC